MIYYYHLIKYHPNGLTPLGFSCHARGMAASAPPTDTLGSLIYRVRQAQRVLALSPRSDPRDYTDRDTWQRAADQLAAAYFPRAAGRGQLATVEAARSVMLASFVTYPLAYRLPCPIRPDWTHGTVLSWFRRCSGRHLDQWRLAVIESEPPQASAACEALAEHLTDAEWVADTVSELDAIAQGKGRVATFARLVLWPWAYAQADRALDSEFRFSAPPRQRGIMRGRGDGTCSAMRLGNQLWLLASPDFTRRHPDLEWQDIRDGGEWRVLEFRLRWHPGDTKRKAGWMIDLAPELIEETKAYWRSLIEGRGTPQAKAKRIYGQAHKARLRWQYAIGAGPQMEQLRRALGPLWRKRVQAADRKLTFPGLRGFWHRPLVKPRPNPYLDRALSADSWRAMHSPFRVW